MNILYINHYAGSTRHGMEFRPFYLSREWVRVGHRVQIVAAAFSHVRAQQPVLDRGVLDENIEGIAYRWYATPAYEGSGVGRVKNIFSFLRSLWRDARRLAEDFNPDVVIASSTYPMDIWPAKRIARLAKAKLVYEVHDLWPLSPMELGGMSRWHPFIMVVQRAEDYAYRHANCVVSMLPKAQEYMVSRGMLPEKFHYVPNGIDTAEWDQDSCLPDGVNDVIEQVKKRARPIVGYAGTYGLANALDTLLDAAKLVLEDVEFILVGNGPERERLLERVKREAINNVSLLPAIPKTSVPAFLKQCDIAYIGWHHNSLYRFGISPNKLMDYMMAGKSIVHAVEAGNDPVAQAGCGLTVPPEDAGAVRDAILKLAGMLNAERAAMGERGKQFVLAEQTYPVLAKRFLDAIGTTIHAV